MSPGASKPQFEPLIKRARQGDEAAIAELISRVQDRLYRYCLMLTHRREVAEDICQETLIKAFQKLERLTQAEAFMGWLYQLAKNIYVDQMRLKSASETPQDQITEQASAAPDSDLILTVQKVLSQFEPEDRHFLLLVELEGYSYAEVAEIVGLSEDAVRSKLHRLRQEFKKIFGHTKRMAV